MRLWVMLLCALLLPGAAKADVQMSNGFQYYVLSLSWAPNWCATTGDSRNDAECSKHGLTFTLHGLWPQYDAGGYPSNCRSTARDPSKSDTAAMEDIMGSAGLAWHEWKVHGRCSGLSSVDYLALMRKATRSVTIPPLFSKVSHRLNIAPKAIEDAFLESNPNLRSADIAVTCDTGMIQEVRICLSKDLSPRPCGADVRACTLPSAELDAVR